jgi:hypothetical protein
MNEVTEWTVDHVTIVQGIITAILEKTTDNYINDASVSAKILGIPLTYQRIVKREGRAGAIVDFRYKLYASVWKLETQFSTGYFLKSISALVWTGTGDYDRWMRDASLLRLFDI